MNKIIQGDCLEKLKDLEDNSVDSIITDPPYELGFMGKSWDNSGIAYNVDMWKECLRVLKPGGHLLAFGGTRTYHRMVVAIEDAGFEVRDMIEWVYGSGFPKSLNIGKAVDKLQGNEREETHKETKADSTYHTQNVGETIKNTSTYSVTKGTSEWEDWGTALKPAHEPICMARKPLAEKTVAENVLKYGTGGINIDECRVESSQLDKDELHAKASKNPTGKLAENVPFVPGIASEPHQLGRFPANLIHDNSEEVRECFPETKVGARKAGQLRHTKEGDLNFTGDTYTVNNYPANEGNASRFFKSIIYQAKASKSERNKGCEGLEEKERIDYGGFHSEQGLINNNRNPENRKPTTNNHPTVKPIALMEYLIKMVTPKGGIVLDPFAGSGSTLIAAKQNGFQYIGIELTEEYIPIIEARLNAFNQDKLL